MTTTVRSLEEFLALPETQPASEWCDGEVMQKAMPTYEHALVQSLLSFILITFLRANPLGVVGSEMRCIFGPPGGERTYVPDLVFIRAERLRRGPGQPFRAAPDLAVEILSPDDRPDDVAAKVAFYLTHGVRLVWLVEPRWQTVTALTADGRSERWGADDALDGGAVLPGFAAPMRELFPAEA
ncbi:MAG: Uma2 family endonuclease [Dehalococcoidia bacterium]